MRLTEANEAELRDSVRETAERAAAEKAVMRRRLDEAETARNAAEEKLAAGDVARDSWVAEETAKANANARARRRRRAAAERRRAKRWSAKRLNAGGDRRG